MVFFAIWQWFGQLCFVYCRNSSPYVVFLPPFIGELQSSWSNWASHYCDNLFCFLYYSSDYYGRDIQWRPREKKNLYYKPAQRIHLQTCGLGLTFSQKKLKDKGSVRLMLWSQGCGKVSYFSALEICVEWVHLGTMAERIRKLEITSVGRTERALCLWSTCRATNASGSTSSHPVISRLATTLTCLPSLPSSGQYHQSPDTRRYQEIC